MRRGLANLLLLVLLWSCAAPAALAITEADLPPCCRSHGAHHCAMMAMMAPAADDSPGYRANTPQCPYRMLGQTVSVSAAAIAERSLANVLLPRSPANRVEDAGRTFTIALLRSGRSPPQPF